MKSSTYIERKSAVKNGIDNCPAHFRCHPVLSDRTEWLHSQNDKAV